MQPALSNPQMPLGADPQRSGLTSQQKAAVIVRLLIAEGTTLSLSDLPANIQSELVRQMASLRHVDHNTLNSVVEEFIAAFNTTGLSFPGAMDETLALMEGVVSPEASDMIRQEAGITVQNNPWVRLCALEADELLPILTRECIEVGAIILSKLKVVKAADLLALMPGEQARRTTYAMSLTGDSSPNLVRRIGTSLAAELDTSIEREFDGDPVERVGELLNFSPAQTRENVLDGLNQTDAGFAGQVRKAIFTFANVPERVAGLDVPKFTRDVDPAQLVQALAGAKDKDEITRDFILDNMSKRMAESLREEMKELGEVKQKDAENAMTAVVIAIRMLVDRGEITLIVEEEEEDA